MFSIKPPLRGYDDLFSSMIAAIPPGTFYDNFIYPIISWKADPISFTLETDQFNVPVLITLTGSGDYHQNVDSQNLRNGATIVPGNPTTAFPLTLKRGLCRITAIEQTPGGRTAFLDVIATTNAVILEPIAREMFVSQNQFNQQNSAIFSRFSTRLLDQVINFQRLMTGIESLKSITTRLAIRGFVHFPAREIGIPNVVETFSLNTPVFRDSRDFVPFDLERSRILRSTEIEAGEEAHVWFPNLAVTRWLAFISLADSLRQNYQVLDIRDNQVTIKYKGQTQRHRFDFNATGSSLLTNLSIGDCFNNIDMTFSMLMSLNYKWCVWSYLFDEFVTADDPIGRFRVELDTGVLLDQGLNFDGDPTDPFSDGWVGWSLDGRFEWDAPDTALALYGLDSHVVPSHTYTGPICVYPHGPYTQMMNTMNFEFDVDADIGIFDPGTEWDDTYTEGPIVGLGLDILSSDPLTAGQSYLSAVKYVDANYMTNTSGSGLVTIQESNGGDSENVGVVTNGHQYFNLTPTKAGPAITWALSDGTYTGSSPAHHVLPGPFAKFIISPIGPQTLNVPFSVSVQAADQYDNPVTDVGINQTVQVNTVVGFPTDQVQPTSFDLTDGQATVLLSVTTTGSGALRFSLSPAQSDSNVFTVS